MIYQRDKNMFVIPGGANYQGGKGVSRQGKSVALAEISG